MQDNFNLSKYLRHGNKLLNENIGGYFDLKPINELTDFGGMKEDMDDVDRLLQKWKDDPSTDPEGDWRNKSYDQAQASAQDWFDEYEEGRLDEFYGMSIEKLIEALKLFGEPDAENVAPILHKMINQEEDDSMSLEELMGTAMEMEDDDDGFIAAQRMAAGEDDKDFIDGFEETRKEAQQAFIDTVNNLRQMSFEDDDIIDMFKKAFYGK